MALATLSYHNRKVTTPTRLPESGDTGSGGTFLGSDVSNPERLRACVIQSQHDWVPLVVSTDNDENHGQVAVDDMEISFIARN